MSASDRITALVHGLVLAVGAVLVPASASETVTRWAPPGIASPLFESPQST